MPEPCWEPSSKRYASWEAATLCSTMQGSPLLTPFRRSVSKTWIAPGGERTRCLYRNTGCGEAYGTGDEVASLAAYVASPEAAFITDAGLAID